MAERRKPGPHPENPLVHDLKVRVDDQTLEEINYCIDRLNITRSQVLRRGVKELYEILKKE